jgi:hypothetical protein
MSQASYSTTPDKAFPGLLGDGPHSIYSRANGAGAELKFGVAVIPDSSNPDTQVEAFATGETVLGVVAHEHQNAVAGTSSLSDGDMASVVVKGLVWVLIDQDVAVGDPVFVRHTAGAGEFLGAFRMDADTADAEEITSGAKWVEGGTSANGFALLEINLP